MVLIATAITLLVVMILYWLDTENARRTSWALWLPLAWWLVASSRNISEWFSVGGAAGAYTEGSPLDRTILSALMALGVLVLLQRNRAVLRALRPRAALLTYFMLCLVSVLWSDFPDVAVKRWFRASGDVVMVLVVLTESRPLDALKNLFARVGFVVIPVSLLFIRYYPQWGRTYGTYDARPTVTGVTTSKNLLGMVCLIYGLSALWRLLEYWGNKERRKLSRPIIAQGVLLALSLLVLRQADSATSLACLAIGGVVLVVSRTRFGRDPLTVYGLVTVMIATAFAVLFLGVGSGLLGGLGRDSSLTGRDEIWRLVLSMPNSALLGAGYESFWLGERLVRMWVFYPNLNQAHNGYLEIYLNLGIVGVVTLALMLLASFRVAVRAVVAQAPEGGLLLAYFIAAVIYNFTEAGFKMMHPVWLGFLLSAVGIVARAPQRKRHFVVAPEPVQVQPDTF